MLLTNHVLTGVLLGLTIDDPILLAPTAVASHLALDMTPHFGPGGPKPAKPDFRSPLFLILGTADFTLSVAVAFGACLLWPGRALHVVIGAVGAALPDLTYIPVTVFGQRIYRAIPGYQAMILFLARIQRYEKPPGIITEAVWASLMLYLLTGMLN